MLALQDLIDQPMLDVDAPRMGALQVSEQFLELSKNTSRPNIEISTKKILVTDANILNQKLDNY